MNQPQINVDCYLGTIELNTQKARKKEGEIILQFIQKRERQRVEQKAECLGFIDN